MSCTSFNLITLTGDCFLDLFQFQCSSNPVWIQRPEAKFSFWTLCFFFSELGRTIWYNFDGKRTDSIDPSGFLWSSCWPSFENAFSDMSRGRCRSQTGMSRFFGFLKVQILGKLPSFYFSDGSEIVFRASLNPTCVGWQNKPVGTLLSDKLRVDLKVIVPALLVFDWTNCRF